MAPIMRTGGLLLALSTCVGAISCVDESGSVVDWWFVYKYPVAASSEYSGRKYSVMTSASLAFEMSASEVTSSDSIIGKTLAPIYAQTAGVSHVFYNDQWPNGSWTENYGHSKGVFAFDDSGGA